jgi:hypothetical protein
MSSVASTISFKYRRSCRIDEPSFFEDGLRSEEGKFADVILPTEFGELRFLDLYRSELEHAVHVSTILQ